MMLGSMDHKDVMLSIHSFTKYPTRAHAVPRPIVGPRDREETARSSTASEDGGAWCPGVNNVVQSASQKRCFFFLN